MHKRHQEVIPLFFISLVHLFKKPKPTFMETMWTLFMLGMVGETVGPPDFLGLQIPSVPATPRIGGKQRKNVQLIQCRAEVANVVLSRCGWSTIPIGYAGWTGIQQHLEATMLSNPAAGCGEGN